MRDRLAVIGFRLKNGASAGTVVTLAVALVATVFGVGALGKATKVLDGNVWLWSGASAQVSRVNAQTGRVDLRQPVVEARGHRVRVTQNDRYLILHDLDTGRVTSVDLKTLGFSGRLDVGTAADVRFVLDEQGAFIIDRSTGEVRTVNPATLQPTGTALRVPGPLVGGELDDDGVLWVAAPGQGTAIGITATGGRPAIAKTVAVAAPGHDLAVTVLDHGVLAADRSGRDLVAVVGRKPHKVTSPVPLTGAVLPDRTHGPLAAVTVPPVRAVVSLSEGGRDAQPKITQLNGDGVHTAVPFSGRLYVPDADGRRVRVYQPGGPQVSVVSVPGSGGDLELDVREKSLFINDPGGRNAAVVAPDGKVKVVDKNEGPSTIGGDRPSPRPEVTRSRPSSKPDRPQPAPTARPTRQPPKAPKPKPTPTGSRKPKPRPTPTVTSTPRPTPTPTPTPTPGDRPGAPVPVTALAGDGEVRLSWTHAYSPDAPVDTYTVTWNGGGSLTVPGGRSRALISGLANGRDYVFRVKAANRFGTGPFAQSEEVTPTPSQPPPTPTRVTVEVKDGAVVVCWDKVEEATGYRIHAIARSGGGSYPDREWGTGPIVDVNGRPRVEARLTGVPAGSWSFTVVAKNASGATSGTSEPSEAVQVGQP